MTPDPVHLPDKLIRHLNTQAKAIFRGEYSGVDQIYPFIDSGGTQPEVGELAENFILMTTKLEAREFDLNRRIEELSEKNQALTELSRQRTEGSVVFFSLLFIMSLFTFLIEILRVVSPANSSIKFIVFRSTDLLFVLIGLYFVFFTKLPFAKFGLNLDRWKKSLLESLAVTGALVVLFVGIKWMAVRMGWMDGSKGLVDFKILDWTFILYLLIAPLQEFLARGVCLTSIERNITGRFAKPGVIILSALVFSLPHMTYSLSFAVWTLGGGIIWGILYMRHRTILGVSISHYIAGTLAFLCGFIG